MRHLPVLASTRFSISHDLLFFSPVRFTPPSSSHPLHLFTLFSLLLAPSSPLPRSHLTPSSLCTLHSHLNGSRTILLASSHRGYAGFDIRFWGCACIKGGSKPAVFCSLFQLNKKTIVLITRYSVRSCALDPCIQCGTQIIRAFRLGVSLLHTTVKELSPSATI
ncbi:hypothetical protein BC939DRAFT_439205 [Gamsiella multidivaricata]|uniref:uncharacterized protein n=1 Tax=Gamsiella multidivaricata TaxID=101098 RepID=UPI002220DC91|nr:uncharacterized protein BC939DRAFT_439205 [Gamsiella multidivaricata]KAI7830393.1 hypothetical protein BC939DRAFT_439205 [Gamsiella multidivaricata]